MWTIGAHDYDREQLTEHLIIEFYDFVAESQVEGASGADRINHTVTARTYMRCGNRMTGVVQVRDDLRARGIGKRQANRSMCLGSLCRAYRGGVPTTFHRRPAPCTHCGDVVLVCESQVGKLFGLTLRRAPKIRFEHADAGPGGETFDPVDDGCRRPRVAG